VLLIFALLQLLWIYLVRRRIPFSATILRISVGVINQFPSVFTVSYGSIFVQFIFLLIWLVATSSILNRLQNSGNVGVAAFFLLLSFYWTSQVIKNVVHVTVSGVFASWYFLYPAAMPENPTQKSLKRACGTSLGSIALGSLLVAIIRTFKHMLEAGRGSRNGFVRCCLVCLLRCLDDLISFFNVYAYVHVAMYGSTYCQAARQTWALIKARGWDLLINDQLIDPVLFFGSFLVGVMTAAITALVGGAIMQVQSWGVWTVAGFLVGFAIAICAMVVVESCVATLFVAFAEDPDALARTKAQEYQALNSAFHGRMVELQQQARNDNN